MNRLRYGIASIAMAGLILLGFVLATDQARAAGTPNSFIIAPSSQPPGSAVGPIYSSFAPQWPGYIENIVISANASATQAVPAGTSLVIFSANCNFWVARGASAAVPASTTTDGSGLLLNPGQLSYDSTVTQFTVTSDAACKISEWFYKR